MQSFFSKRTIVVIIILGLFGIFLFLYLTFHNKPLPVAPIQTEIVNTGPVHKVIGYSVLGRSIDSYIYGNGQTKLAFIGGIHGGYEWNSVVLAYKFMDYLEANPELIPKNISVVVVPSLNPDGVFKVVGKEGRFTENDISEKISTVPGRFNANGVDLNRNFDCKWQPKSTWQEKVVSGGTSAFSEPESQALKNFIGDLNPKAVVFWHSQSGTVYASQCEHGILPETLKIMNLYAKAGSYPAVSTFDAYATSGDAEGWLAKIGIPALTVELKTHQSIDWQQNLAGAEALFEYYSQ